MKKLFTFIVGAVVSLGAYAQDFDSGGLMYSVLSPDDKTCAVTGHDDLPSGTVLEIPERVVDDDGVEYTVTEIGENAFFWTELNSLSLPSTLEVIGENAFYGISGLREVVIPASVNLIRASNFNDCSSLEKVTIADSATPLELSNYDFVGNNSLTELYVGRNVAYPEGNYCFNWNNSISRIVLGPEVSSLPAGIFSDSSDSLKLVESQNPTPPTIGENSLGYYTPTIIVPAGSEDEYKSAWEQYASSISVAVDAKSISFEKDEETIYSGQIIKLPLNVEPEGATVIWSSSNRYLVNVTNEGSISYNSDDVGEVTITASTLNGHSAEMRVEAKHWATFSVNNEQLNPGKSVTLSPGGSCQVEAIKSELLDNSPINWGSSDDSIATVNEDGLISAVSAGNAQISVEFATPDGGSYTYWFQVKVRNEITSVEAVDPVISLWKNNEAQINLIFEPQDDPDVNRELTWSVSNPEVAEVYQNWDENYYVRGLDAGTTTITGTTANGLSVDIEVVVKSGIEQIIFSKEVLYLSPEKSAKLEFTTVPEVNNVTLSYSSDNEDIATVDEDGIITAHNFGDTYIAVWAENPWGGTDWIGSQRVEVVNLPQSVTLVGSTDYEGSVNEWTQLQIEYTPNDPDIFREIQWTVENPEIGFFNPWDNTYGFHGNKLGTTAFRGVAANGDVLEGTITISGIMIVVDGVATDGKDINLGSEFKIDVEASSEALLEHLTYVSDNTEVVTVTEDGIVHAVGYGTTNVRVISENEGRNYEDYIYITVKPSDGIAFNTNKVTINQGDYRYISILRADNVGWSNVTWTSSDENVVAITWCSENEAELSYRGPGSATVTATDSYGNVATCEVVCVANIENLTFNTDKIYVAPAGTFQLEYTTVPEMTGQTIRFESGNEAVATVDPETGLVTGVNYGSTYIHAIADNGRSWSVPVEVCIFPESVRFVGSSDYEGTLSGWTWLKLEFIPDNDDVCKHIEWTDYDPEIVYIDTDNSFIGRNFGTTAFRGVAVNGDVLEGTITINGLKILVNGEETRNKEVNLGSEFKLDVEASSENLLEHLSFTSENTEVVTVTEDGMVKAVGYGSTNVRVRTTAEVSENVIRYYEASISITVKPSDGIAFNTNQVTINQGDYRYISILRADNLEWSSITWASSDENVVAISWSDDYEAQLSYVGPGQATVTATDAYGNVASCEVTCVANIEGLTFNTDKIYVAPGGTFQLEYTTVPEMTGQTIRFESENESIATVDSETGLVTGVDYGNTRIRAIPSYGWRSWYVPVEVCNLPESVTLVGSTDYEGVANEWTPLQIEYTPNDDDVCREIQWTVENPEIVHFTSWDNTYAFYGDKLGRTSFRGVAVNGDVLEGTITIDGIEFVIDGESVRSKDLNLGEEFRLELRASSDDLLENITFTSNNTEVATVTQDGMVTAVGYGSTNVRAMTYVNGKYYYANIDIIVRPSEGIVFESQHVTLTPYNSQMIYIIRAANLSWSDVRWKSSNEDVVRINWSYSEGASISYVGAGTATVTATDEYGNEATCEVTCLGNIDNITFNTNKIYISPGETFQLEWTIEPEGTGQTIRFESENESIATVDPETGLVTGVNYGETYIRAIATNGWSWYVPVQVCNLPESVRFVGSSDYVGVLNGYTWFQIEYTPNDNDIFKEIQWTVDNPEIGFVISTFDKNYAFFGRNLGTTAVRGVAANGDVLEGTITIEGLTFVNEEGESITSKRVEVGSETQLEVAASENLPENIVYTYTSDNPEVATVSEDGVVTAVGPGVANITVKAVVRQNGRRIIADGRNYVKAVTEVRENEWQDYEAQITITVLPSEGIAFNTTKLTLSPYEYSYLDILGPENAELGKVTWISSDENVVTITVPLWSDKEAQISYVGPGRATVTATDEYGNVATCEVTCLGSIDNVTFNTEKIYVAPGKTFQLTWTIVPEGTGQTLRFESENEAVATVDPETGLVTGVDYGNTYIRAIAQNGWQSWSVPVEVCKVPESVKLVGSSDYKGIINGYTPLQIKYTPDDDDLNKYIQWTIDDPEVGSIAWHKNETTNEYEYAFIGYKLGTTAFKGVAVNGDVLEGTITNGIVFDKKEVTLVPEKMEHINVERFKDIDWTELTWESSDENVVTIVTSPGNQAALNYQGAGEAIVTATDRNGYVAICKVTGTGILITPAEVKIPSNSLSTAGAFDAYKLEVKVFPATAEVSTILWRSQDTNLVMVGVDGQLISNANTGVTKVFASTFVNGYYSEAACEVTVYEFVPVTNITPGITTITAEVGTKVQLIATVDPENASNKDLYWESSDEDIATVDEDGLVTIQSEGSVAITAYSVENPMIFATFYVIGTIVDGVEGINEDEATFDIYDMNGILVKKNATAEEYKQLDRGIYLIKKGDKVIKVKH